MPRRDDRRIPCPFCEYPLLFVRRTRSERNGPGFVRLRMYRCAECSRRFLSLEMPIEMEGRVLEFPKTNLAAEDVWANLRVFKAPNERDGAAARSMAAREEAQMQKLLATPEAKAVINLLRAAMR